MTAFNRNFGGSSGGGGGGRNHNNNGGGGGGGGPVALAGGGGGDWGIFGGLIKPLRGKKGVPLGGFFKPRCRNKGSR